MSDRLVNQNVWNATLSEMRWDEQTESALRAWGADEFFEGIAAIFPYEDQGPLMVPDNPLFLEEERRALQALVDVLNQASDYTDGLSGEAFLRTPWAAKIAELMNAAAAVMKKRGGYFSSVREESEPSILHPAGCPATIYMPLLDEGTDVWRPVDGEPLAGSGYRILGSMPEDERWAFQPGTIVRCEWRTFADGTGGMTVLGSDS
jgi:hypothetical protein